MRSLFKIFLLRQCRDDGDHGVLEESAGVKVRLDEGPIADVVGIQPIQMLERFQNALFRVGCGIGRIVAGNKSVRVKVERPICQCIC